MFSQFKYVFNEGKFRWSRRLLQVEKNKKSNMINIQKAFGGW